jgi:hypothetical protein
MPIFRINNKLIFYAHVPKAGGSSVADYFKALGARSAFTFGAQWRQRPRDRWSSTSPQHIDAKSLAELFPVDFFDACFTVVRHPEDRIISEYKFRAGRSKIHAALPLSDWLHIVTAASNANPFAFDGHVRPQTDFLPANCKVFKLEDGHDGLGEWIAEVADIKPPVPPFSQHSNKSMAMETRLNQNDRELINTLYAKDFEELGYEKRSSDGLTRSHAFTHGKSRLLGKISRLITNMASLRIPY